MDVREILQRLVNMVDASDSNDQLVELATDAELWLEEDQSKPMVISVSPQELYRWADWMDQIIKPHVEYDPDRQVICDRVIEANKKAATYAKAEIISRTP